MRKAFIKTVRAEMDSDKSLVVFLGDISVAGFLNASDELIDGVHNCGILEQAMVSFAAGCAVGGLYPIVQTIVPFIVERAFEQIKLDFCAQENPGLIVGVGGGLEYSKLGYTHQTLWDTALLSNLENLTLFTPTVGPSEVTSILQSLIRTRRLAYARLTESYLKTTYDGPYGIAELMQLKPSKGANTATVVCGAFPGIQALVDQDDVDVFAYSFPNTLPRNVSLLAGYDRVDVWEFGTTSLLATGLKLALPRIVVRGFNQRARFFKTYGDQAARDFIASNWSESR